MTDVPCSGRELEAAAAAVYERVMAKGEDAPQTWRDALPRGDDDPNVRQLIGSSYMLARVALDAARRADRPGWEVFEHRLRRYRVLRLWRERVRWRAMTWLCMALAGHGLFSEFGRLGVPFVGEVAWTFIPTALGVLFLRSRAADRAVDAAAAEIPRSLDTLPVHLAHDAAREAEAAFAEAREA